MAVRVDAWVILSSQETPFVASVLFEGFMPDLHLKETARGGGRSPYPSIRSGIPWRKSAQGLPPACPTALAVLRPRQYRCAWAEVMSFPGHRSGRRVPRNGIAIPVMG